MRRAVVAVLWALAPWRAALAQQATSPPPGGERELSEEEALFEVEERGDEGLDEEQTSTQQRDRARQEEDELDGETSREALQRAGFLFGDFGGERRRSTAFLMALFPGLVAHGAGHFYLGDRQTAWTLAAMELGGVALIGLGALAPRAFSRRASQSSVARPAFYTGVGLVLSSYVIDVVGVTRSETPLLYRSPLKRRGASARLGYEFMQARYFPLRNVIAAELELDTGAFQATARSRQDVALLSSFYGGGAGWRIWQVDETEHQVRLRVDGELMQLRDVGRFSRVQGAALLSGVLDLGVVSPRLRRLYLGLEGGYGYQLYALPEAITPEENAQRDSPPELEWEDQGVGLVPWEMFGGMMFTERLHLQLSYRRYDGEPLAGVNRLLGVPALKVDYRSGRNFDLTFEARYGSGFSVGAGLRIWLYEERRP